MALGGFMSRSARSRLGLVQGLVLAVLCTGCEKKAPNPCPECDGPVQVTPEEFHVGVKNQLDLLFVVDTSEPLAQSVVEYLPRFMDALGQSQYYGFDLNLAVVSADLAAAGALENTPVGTTCDAAHLADPSQHVISAWRSLSECPFQGNFVGELGAAFACYAALPQGSGYGQPLEAMRRALTHDQGFLRDDAYLMVVFIGARDDCSAPAETALFDPDATDLGPAGPFRCFRYGTVCDGTDPGTAPGERQRCVPGAWDPDPRHQLVPVEEYAAFLKGLKVSPRAVHVGVITGPTESIVVGTDAEGAPTIEPSCASGDRAGYPGLRFARLIKQFDSDRSSLESYCSEELDSALRRTFSGHGDIVGAMCLSAALRDREPETPGLQPDLVVSERSRARDGTLKERVLPACDPAVCDPATVTDCRHFGPAMPADAPKCWYIWPSTDSCPRDDSSTSTSVRSGYAFRVAPNLALLCGVPPESGQEYSIQYASCPANPSTEKFDCSAGCAFNWPACCPTPYAGCQSE
jgi:hypothetical protein